jgi:hypothetical protein
MKTSHVSVGISGLDRISINLIRIKRSRLFLLYNRNYNKIRYIPKIK